MNVVLLGPPGVGKGTQATALIKAFGIPHISTGDMFREAIKQETELGIKVKAFLDTGQLVPDDLTIGIVKERLAKEDCVAGFLLDGFPRTVYQAEMLSQILKHSDRCLDAVINIEAPKEILLNRIVGRRICSQCGTGYHIEYNAPKIKDQCDECGGELYQRSDDNEDAVASRLEVYSQENGPLVEYYTHQGVLISINGNQEVDKVSREIYQKMEK